MVHRLRHAHSFHSADQWLRAGTANEMLVYSLHVDHVLACVVHAYSPVRSYGQALADDHTAILLVAQHVWLVAYGYGEMAEWSPTFALRGYGG